MNKNWDENVEEGIPSETDLTDKLLYQLACIFFGSAGFGEYSSKFDCFPNLRKRFQESEANLILVSLAATLRRRNESASERQKKEVSEISPASVGKYFRDIDSNMGLSDLSFREACNKIIHASKLEFTYEQGGGILKPIVYLYGTFHDKKWKVELDVKLFIQCAWDHG